MPAYYNEIDPYAAAWLRNLIAAGHIAPGDVDERSIVDVRAADLAGYDQCHFFAGIGGWSHALRLAGWPDDRPVWTGSCPCQPFSAAGKQGGFDDARHLWPTWFDLIRECRPRVVFGEQVASPAGLGWLDLVHSDMEDAGYAFAAVDCCSAGIGAPHIRQRLGFVADADDAGMPERADQRAPGALGVAGRMGKPDRAGSQPGDEAAALDRHGHPAVATGGGHSTGPLHGFWRDADWLLCRDGKWRPVEARIQQMVDGVPVRMGRLRPDLAAETESIIAQAAERLEATRDEILRTLRDRIAPAILFGEAGDTLNTQQAQILFSYLFELARQERDESNTTNGAGASDGPCRELRMLWRDEPLGDSPRQRKLEGQPSREFADAVRLLSSAVARFASEAEYPMLYADAPASHPLTGQSGDGADQRSHKLGRVRTNRVGRLRAYGNAINPHQFAEIIAAYMDCRP